MNKRFMVLFCSTVLGAFLQIRADIIVSNLGEPSINGDGWLIGLNQSVGMRFTAGTVAPSWILEGVDLNVGSGGVLANDFTLTLHADNGGLPGTLIASFSGPEPTNVLSSDIINYVPDVAVTLNPSTTYWLTALSSAGSYRWTYTDPYSSADTGANGWGIGDNVVLSTDQGSTWVSYPDEPARFAVHIAPVPEPTALALTSLGALALWRLRRRWLVGK